LNWREVYFTPVKKTKPDEEKISEKFLCVIKQYGS
jgi:hypothetical protein